MLLAYHAATGSDINTGVTCEGAMAWSILTFALVLDGAVSVNLTENVTENVTGLPRCDTVTSFNMCRDTCTAVHGLSQITYAVKDCLCQTREDTTDEWMFCCDADFACATTTTTTKARVTCHELASVDDCKQACLDQYGMIAMDVLFTHRETCRTNNVGESCCDSIDGARALSLLPAATISMSVLVAHFL